MQNLQRTLHNMEDLDDTQAGRLTFTLRSLRLRQPYLERRNDLGFLVSFPGVVSLGFNMLAERCLGKLHMLQTLTLRFVEKLKAHRHGQHREKCGARNGGMPS